MAHIELLSETKKKINYDLIFEDLGKEYPEFNFLDSNKRLENLYLLNGKIDFNNSKSINLDIFVKNDYKNFDRIERRINSKNIAEILNILKIKKDVFLKINKIYNLSNILNIEISKYILNKHLYLQYINNFLSYSFDNDNINFIINEISKNSYLKTLLGNIKFNYAYKEIDKNSFIKSLNSIVEKFNDINFDNFINNDFNITIEIESKHLIKFLITKLEEQDYQVNNDEIVDVFNKLEKEAKGIGDISIKYSIIILIAIILLNLVLFILSLYGKINFKIEFIFGYIPLLVLEILLFKFMFFFFDRYNSYSKISFLYNYYIGLLKADNIYTTDKKFTLEQNFSLREKTYNELINLSSHIKGMVDKKGTSQKDSLELFKEINNISPFFKNMYK